MSYTFSRTWRIKQPNQLEVRHWSAIKTKLHQQFPVSEVAKWTYKTYIGHKIEMNRVTQNSMAARVKELEEQESYAKRDKRPTMQAFLGKPLQGNRCAVHAAEETVFCVDWAPPGKYIVPWPESSAWEYEGEQRRYTPHNCNFNRMMPILRDITNDTVAWYKCHQYSASKMDERFRLLTYEDIYHPPESIAEDEINPWLQDLIKSMDDPDNENLPLSPPRAFEAQLR